MPSNIPTKVDGLRVVQYAELPTKLLPKGYISPPDGPSLEPIGLVVIAVDDELDDPLYWVRCLNDELQTVTGDMYYALASAQQFLLDEYGVQGVAWQNP